MSGREGQRCDAGGKCGAVQKPPSHSDETARPRKLSKAKTCSKEWRESLLQAAKAWAAENADKAPRTAHRRGVSQRESELAQRIKNLRMRSRNGSALSNEERAAWESVASWIFAEKVSVNKAIEQAENAYKLAHQWLKQHTSLPNSKKDSGHETNVLVHRLLRVRANWTELPDGLRARFQALPGWSWDDLKSKERRQMRDSETQTSKARKMFHRKELWLDKTTELYKDTDTMEEAHPDRTAITKGTVPDYRIYLPHARPGCVTTSFSDMCDDLMKLLVNASFVSKKKRQAMGTEERSGTSSMVGAWFAKKRRQEWDFASACNERADVSPASGSISVRSLTNIFAVGISSQEALGMVPALEQRDDAGIAAASPVVGCMPSKEPAKVTETAAECEGGSGVGAASQSETDAGA